VKTNRRRRASPHLLLVLRYVCYKTWKLGRLILSAPVIGGPRTGLYGESAPSPARVGREFPQPLVRRYMVTRCPGQRARCSNYATPGLLDKEWETD
jgi:hypothetical protein